MKYLDLTGLSHFKDKIVALLNNKQDTLTGGTTRQVLTKNSSTNGDLSWQDRDTVISPTKPTTNERVWFKYGGKNLFNIENITVGYWVNSLGQYNENSGWNIGEKIKAKPSTSYTMSREETTGAYQVGIAEYDENYNFVQQQAQWLNNVNAKTFITSATTQYIRPMYNKTYSMTNIQFEEGSTATPYEVYIQPSILVDNQEIYNKNKIDNLTNYSLNEKVIGTWINRKTTI